MLSPRVNRFISSQPHLPVFGHSPLRSGLRDTLLPAGQHVARLGWDGHVECMHGLHLGLRAPSRCTLTLCERWAEAARDACSQQWASPSTSRQGRVSPAEACLGEGGMHKTNPTCIAAGGAPGGRKDLLHMSTFL